MLSALVKLGLEYCALPQIENHRGDIVCGCYKVRAGENFGTYLHMRIVKLSDSMVRKEFHLKG